jgi:disulfide bond formation protein DsbB
MLTTSSPNDEFRWQMLFGAWLVAAMATLGALYLGEVRGLPICSLCWYQRLFMFPLALLLPFGLFPFDARMVRYGLVLAVPGLAFAVFQMLMVAGVIPEALQPCSQGVPCGRTVAVWFGFVTIPLLSAAAFLLITALLLAALRRRN